MRQVEQQQQHEKARRKVKAVKSHAVRSRALCAEGLRQMSAAGSDYAGAQERWGSAQAASEARQERTLVALRDPGIEEAAQAVESDENDDEGMAEAVALVGANDAGAMALDAQVASAPGRGASADSVADLLAQLRTEPEDAAECAAKFQLYEEYAKQVEKMRTSVFDLHKESEAMLPAAINADMRKQLNGIDTTDSMGIPDGAREWFVFHMMRAAEKNNRTMAAILESFEKKLEFLAQNDQAECPICFEDFVMGTEHAAETLSCCHKVCKECWAHWVTVMKPPFCPLCRHDEFLGVVMTRAGQQA